MKNSARMGELVKRLNLNEDFKELWGMIVSHRDLLIEHAIHDTKGDPAENRGAAKGMDNMVKAVEFSPKKTELANMKGK